MFGGELKGMIPYNSIWGELYYALSECEVMELPSLGRNSRIPLFCLKSGAAKRGVVMRWDGGVWGCVWAAWVGSRLVQEMGS